MSNTEGILTEIRNERARQQHIEGFSKEHDDTHYDGELGKAGAAYILASIRGIEFTPAAFWPWADGFKPRGDRENMIRGIALAVAEVERRDRHNDWS